MIGSETSGVVKVTSPPKLVPALFAATAWK